MPVGFPAKSYPPTFFAPSTASTSQSDASVNRKDGRKSGQLRKIFIKANVVSEVSGSAYIEVGNTKLMVSIVGPREIPRGEEAPMDRGVLSVVARFAPFASAVRQKRSGRSRDLQTDTERALSGRIHDALRPCVIVEKFPNAQLDLFVTIIEDDGGAFTAALSCCSMALADAGVDIYDIIIGCTLKMYGPVVLLDPSKEEEDWSSNDSVTDGDQNDVTEAVLSIGYMPSLNQVTATNQQGYLKPQQLAEAIQILIAMASDILPVITKAIVKSLKQTAKIAS